jgi:drug/metabolite transporter (DMT)-like permease
MAAVVGGLGAALIWSVGTVFSSRVSRTVGPILTLAWVMLIGLVALSLTLPFSGSAHISARSALWLLLGGAGNVVGLLILYHSLRIGQMGVVMPIVSIEGGIAAVLAIIAGQPVGALRGVALAVTVVGVMLTGMGRRPVGPASGAAAPDAAAGALMPREEEPSGWRRTVVAAEGVIPPPRGHRDRRAAAWAVVAAFSFGVSLWGTGRAGAVLPAAWAIMPPRVIGVVAVTVPLAARGQLGIPRSTVPLLLVAGVLEVAGFFSYALGAKHGIAVAAVMATLTGAFGAVIGRLLYGERLRAAQLVGVALIMAGVATVSALSSG